MADENRPLKYARYAIGEIVLVVIGILIALQINNWNEDRKESKLELEILSGLYNDIANNKIKIDQMISRDSIIVAGNQHILELLKDVNSTFHDSLQFSFGNINRYDVFFPQQMAYETLKSKGFHTIKVSIGAILDGRREPVKLSLGNGCTNWAEHREQSAEHHCSRDHKCFPSPPLQ